MFNKLKEWSGVAVLAIILLQAIFASGPKFGNATASYQDAAQGFRVNGTEVISASAVVDAPQISTTGTTTLGTTHVGSFVEGGSGVSITTTSTLTAAQVCTGNPVTVANTTATITISFPVATATNAFSNCLTTDGDFTRFLVLNNGTNTVQFATSTGDTIATSFNASTTKGTLSTSTGPFSNGLITVLRVNSTTNAYFLTQFGVSL